MTLQYSTTLRNAQLDAIEVMIGESPTLEIRSGTKPSNAAAADTGTLLASLTLPVNWMNSASNGVVSMAGTWSDNSADGTGTATYFRIKKGGVCHIQGTVSLAASNPDMVIDNDNIVAGQSVWVLAFDIGAGNV